MEELQLWFEINRLQSRYLNVLDNNQLESWPDLFIENGFYEIVPKENEDMGLSIGLIRCTNKRMLHDRVLSLRKANVYEEHSYRHMTSGLIVNRVEKNEVETTSNYVVIQTRSDGESIVYQAGRYVDRVVNGLDGWKYASKRVIYDTSRVQTLLATPI